MSQHECSCTKDLDPGEVVICRCEEIIRREIEMAIEMGCRDLDAVKRAIRAGMGMCQSKSCSTLITRMISQKTGIPPSELKPFSKRAPLRPIKASALNQD